MTISLSEDIFNTYREFADYFLDNDNFSRLCVVYYAPIKVACNCGSTANHYQHGGLAPFNFNNSCGLCGGTGLKDSEVTDTIRLRQYWNPKNWIKIGGTVIEDAKVQVIGYMADLPKFKAAASIKLVSEETGFDVRLTLAGPPAPHGFAKNRYFICFLK